MIIEKIENKIKNNFKVNDILLSKWGYEQTNNTFYLVTKASDLYVWIVEVKPYIKARKGSSGLDELRLYDCGLLSFVGNKPFKRKILNYSKDLNPKENFVKINNYEYAEKFNENEWVYCSWCN